MPQVKIPDSWREEFGERPPEGESSQEREVDYAALVARVEAMDASEFAAMDLNELTAQYTRGGSW